MNSLLRVLTPAAFTLSLGLAAVAQEIVPVRQVLIPASAAWSMVPAGAPAATVPLRMEFWIRDGMFKRVSTFGDGHTETLITRDGYGISYDTRRQDGAISYLSALLADAGPETQFSRGYANPFAMLSWVSERTFVREERYEGKPAQLFQKSVPGAEDGEIAWKAWIDPTTKLPLACAFGERIYAFANLRIGVEIPKELFDVPSALLPIWNQQAKELSHQAKLREINSRGRR